MVSRFLDTAERILFGATAEEKVAQINAMIERRVDLAFDRFADRLAAAFAEDGDESQDDTAADGEVR